MLDSKGMFDSVQKDYTVRVEQWIETVNKLQMELPSPNPEKQKTTPIAGYMPTIDGVRNGLSNLSASLSASKRDLDHVVEVFNLKKTRAEVLRTTVESWPPRGLVERLTYISTALFPAGGIPVALAGGWNWESGIVSVIMWMIGTVLLAWSLVEVRKTDREKWAFFSREFDINPEGLVQPNLSQSGESAGNRAILLTKWTALLSLAAGLFISGNVFLTSLAIDEEVLTSAAGWILGSVMIILGLVIICYIWMANRKKAPKEAEV